MAKVSKRKAKSKSKPAKSKRLKPKARPQAKRAAKPKPRRPAAAVAMPALAPAAVKQLQSGACVPPGSSAAVFAALNTVASAHNLDPAAIAGIINTESLWKTTAGANGGTYIGLTQVSPDFVQSLQLTRAQFLALPAERQIGFYGTWLDSFKFNAKMAQNNIVLLALPLAEQAAVLQGMQFAPNGTAWKIALAHGDLTVRTTTSKQASFLGDTSIGAMTNYYQGLFAKHPPVYA